MSEENVEIARRSFEAFNRAFTEGADDLYALLDPEVEWIPATAILEGRSYHGHEGVRRWIEDMKRDWEDFEPRPEEFLDLGDDRVLAWALGMLGAGEATSRSTSRVRPGWRNTGRGSSCGCRRSPSDRRPSKPPGCRSSSALIPLTSKVDPPKIGASCCC